ncbi:LysR family transcriptional regulator [Pelosinus fermentans]|uniref:Transcriptional regulator, LysR family n=1 Tax=Pelosinus fermentans JBW45 TaxID=1192197 RepID=I9NK87_9FIRM|nr:LysR family transcriptional regulator [Pelosinus fermentans]AJQ25419.1 transcriptional regulator, LysR family [Pelosinus fermentans JBW45]
MELRHLRYFVAVAEELHFTRAAERLNMAQPPLSQQIRQLESELGVQLFQRTKRQVELTAAGKNFLKNVYKILIDLDKTCDSALRAQKGEIGNIIVGFTGTATYDILPKLLQPYRSKFPSVDISVLQLSTTDQIQSLLNGEINIGILCAPIKNSQLNFEVIHQEPFIIAMPRNHPLASKSGPIEVQEFSKELFIMIPRNSGQIYYDTIINICHNAGFSPNITQEVHELHTSISLVAAGMGVALVPDSIQNLRVRGITYRQLKNSVSTLKTALAWRNDETSPLVHTFIALAKKSIQKLA